MGECLSRWKNVSRRTQGNIVRTRRRLRNVILTANKRSYFTNGYANGSTMPVLVRQRRQRVSSSEEPPRTMTRVRHRGCGIHVELGGARVRLAHTSRVRDPNLSAGLANF